MCTVVIAKVSCGSKSFQNKGQTLKVHMAAMISKTWSLTDANKAAVLVASLVA